MRQLRVVGLSDDGEAVIVEDPIRHERFSVPGDERLRAAARGDVRRLGQMEIAHTSPLRPRDIQARIRAGETAEQVAESGGVSVGHVERFAYPVLLERARVAEMSRRAHPQAAGEDRTDPRTLGEIVAATFAARGQDHEDAAWDAWKGEDGQWTVVMSWQAGRSDNTASWIYRPGASGGVVLARDDHARDLVGEAVGGPRRRSTDRPAPAAGDGETPEPADEVAVADATEETAETPEVVEAQEEAPALAASGDTAPPRPDRRRPGGASKPRSRAGARGVPDQRDHRRAEAESDQAGGQRDGGQRGGDARGKARKNHPIVPSWEDVLLGTRSPKN